MKFEVGDTIALKSNAEEGKIIGLLDNNMVMVRINKVDFPVFESEIEHPYFNWFINKKFAQPKVAKTFIDDIAVEKRKPGPNLGMHLVFFPIYNSLDDDALIEKVKVVLSNQQNQAYNFYYEFEDKEAQRFKIKSDINAQSEFYLHDISFEQLATNPIFDFSFAEIISNITSSIYQFEEQFSIKPKKIFSYLAEMKEKNEAFFKKLLFNSQIEEFTAPQLHVTPFDLEASKNKANPIKPPSKPIKEDKTIIFAKEKTVNKAEIDLNQFWTKNNELDLHIEKLNIAFQEMSATEKINFQLSIFQKALDSAIINGQTSMIVIHGIGKGVLKNQIHAILNQTKQVQHYVNEYDKRYGYGSTEIFFG